ncbi:Peptide chain release factor 3 [Streptomyces violaceorubidus]
MGDKAHTHPGAAGRATAADHPTSVRNVVLVGPSGSGKTTLVEALALTAGAVNRAGRVEDGGCVSDYDDMEHRQQRSVQLSLVPVEWDGIKINLLDTPGYADFVGELRAGLRAADAALRRLGLRRGGRLDPDALGGVRRRRHAARHRGHAPGGRPRRLRGDDADLRGGLRRRRSRRGTAAVPPAARSARPRRARARDRARGAALAEAVRLRPGRARGLRTRRGRPATARRGPLDADRGDHLGERGRDPHGALPRRRAGRRQDAHRGSGTGRGTRGVLPRPGRRPRGRGRPAGTGHGRTPGTDHARLPDAPGARGAPGHHARGRRTRTADVRSRGVAGRGGRQDVLRPLRRPDLDGPRLLRHPARLPDGARVRSRDDRPRSRGPRCRRADRRPVHAVRQTAAAGHARDRGRPRLRGQADPRGDRGHALGEGRSAADGALGDARPAAAARHRGAQQTRRGQALPGAGPAGRRGPDHAPGAQPGHPPGGAVVPGRGARRRGPGTAAQPLRRPGRRRTPPGLPARDVRRPGGRARAARQAVRRARPVRHLRDRGGAAAGRLGRRVRGQGGRRRAAPGSSSRPSRRACARRRPRASPRATR